MSAVTIEEIERLENQLPPQEQLRLVEDLARHLRGRQATLPLRDLRGAWKGGFSEDFDLDGALNEIRTEWEKEFDDR